MDGWVGGWVDGWMLSTQAEKHSLKEGRRDHGLPFEGLVCRTLSIGVLIAAVADAASTSHHVLTSGHTPHVVLIDSAGFSHLVHSTTHYGRSCCHVHFAEK